MESESLEKLRNEVLALFNSLIMFTAEEHAERIEQIKNLPEEGLKQLRAVFESAQVEQVKQMRELYPSASDLPKKIYVALRRSGVLAKPEPESQEEAGGKVKDASTPTLHVMIQTPTKPKVSQVQTAQKKSKK